MGKKRRVRRFKKKEHARNRKLTKAEFKKKLAQSYLKEDIDDGYCSACYYLEKEINQNIDGEYPISKFLILLEEMEKDAKRQEKEMSKSKNIRGKTI
jgi:hypothetical protein